MYQQQQHALARHAAGDQPTQGVRTAPTPSQPPTPSPRHPLLASNLGSRKRALFLIRKWCTDFHHLFSHLLAEQIYVPSCKHWSRCGK